VSRNAPSRKLGGQKECERRHLQEGKHGRSVVAKEVRMVAAKKVVAHLEKTVLRRLRKCRDGGPMMKRKGDKIGRD
jgi:hypothetical protein